MKIAVVGATGLVGSVILQVLEEFKFPVTELIPVASEKSIGKKVVFCKQEYAVKSVAEAIEACPQIAIFSAGSSTSKKYAELFASKGTYVIDNSSYWRMYDNIPLIVPEVNGHILEKQHHIIANPNCSTIQLVVVLSPLHQLFKLKKMVISTYQSVTGTGVNAVKQLFNERNKIEGPKVYPYQIDLNCFPHGGDFTENDYTTEEIKLVNETHKILNDNSIEVEATVVRVPVTGGHSESVYLEFEKNVTPTDIKKILTEINGIVLKDDPENCIYPMPLFAEGKNEVFVGRIRQSMFNNKAVNLWIVADNLRKGAATNAVQIAQLLLEKKYILFKNQ